MNLSSSDLKKMQYIQLDMLKELDRICRKYNIKYVISGGTLLGAVRHKGFIPWDDDIDVRMLREDYEKFCKICEKELDHEKYFFQNHLTDKEYIWYYAKIRRKGTEYIRTGQEHLKMKTGVFIDIMPSDAVPENKISRWFYTEACFLIKKILYARVGSVTEKKKHIRLLYKMLTLIPCKTAFKCFDWMRTNICKDSRIVASYMFTKPGTPKLLKKWHQERMEFEFEGNMFYGPKDHKRWLSQTYGENYMELPPECDRIIHNTASKYKLL